MKDACNHHHCSQWWHHIGGIFSECSNCHTTADVWYSAVWWAQLGKTTTPISNYNNDGQHSSLKQIWRPWDWRQPGDVYYAPSFLANPGRIASMMNGKVLSMWPNMVSYVLMHNVNSGESMIVARVVIHLLSFARGQSNIHVYEICDMA